MNHLFSYLVLILSMVGFVHSAYAVPIFYTARLDGPSESPPVASPGTGFATVGIDSVNHTLSVDVTFSGLVGNVTVAHIHAATDFPGTGIAGVATTTPTFPGFPAGLGVTSGTYSNVFDTSMASSYNPSFLNNSVNLGNPLSAQATLFQAITEGKAYLNIHTTFSPTGEIRGFLVPEPAITSLMTLGVLGFLFAKRRTASLTSKANQPALHF